MSTLFCTAINCQQLPGKEAFMCTFLPYVSYILSGACASCVYYHRHREFILAIALLCLKNTIPLVLLTTSDA